MALICVQWALVSRQNMAAITVLLVLGILDVSKSIAISVRKNGQATNVQSVKRQRLFHNTHYNLVNMFSPFRPRLSFLDAVEEECNINKSCPSDQFCDVHVCRACLHQNTPCHFIGTCCKSFVCQYGQCTKGVKQGDPGTYCDKSSQCDSTSCCVREVSVNPRTSICKPMLDEYESCGPINLFRQVYNGGKVEPACGPCKTGLQCKNVGIHGLHYVCLKEDDD